MLRLFVSFYVLLMAAYLAHEFFGEISIETWVEDIFVIDKTNDHIGTFHLLEQLHKSLDTNEFNVVIAQYPAHSNLPVELFNRQDPAIKDMVFGENNIFVESADDAIFYYRFKQSDRVIKLGPMDIYAPLENIVTIYDNALFVVLGLSVFLWVFSLQRKLNRLDNAATALGNGDLTVRVSQRTRHKVGNLNHSFNQMAQRIEQLLQGHKSLTNAVAHELRTPVCRMRFQLDMMYEESDECQRKEYMYGISDDLNELSDLVDELLTYARFDREQAPLKLQTHSLAESLQNVIRARHFDSELTLTYDNSDCPQNPLPFDPKNIERAVGNLLTNAQKYAKNQIQLAVQLDAQSCTIVVDDDGPGIPVTDREEIFVPFKRLDDSRTRETGGYGLGLAIVKQIASWHGGTIHVEQAPLGGSRFVLRWPV